MSVIQRIRDKGAWIVFGIIALALVAFILQDSSLRRGNVFSNTSTIGSINGEKIDRTDFQSKIGFFENISKQRGQEMQPGMLNGQVWNYMVQQTLLNQEANRLGLAFTSKELADVLFGDNPPQWMQQQFTDPKTGVFDVNAARQQFAQIKKNTNDPRVDQLQTQFIDPTIQQSIFAKYSALLSGAVYVPKWMAEKTNADNNSVAKASYVFVPYNTISDSAVKVSDDEVEAYVKKHAAQFTRDEETRTVQYVAFSETPTAADSAAVRDQLNTLKPAFTATTDVASFVVSKNSDIPYTEAYKTKSDFKEANADTIMKLTVGEVFGPYVNSGEYELAKLVGKRTVPDTVKVRHILIKTQDGGKDVLPDSIAKKRIDSIAEAIQHGASFDSMVQKYSDDPGSKATQGEYDFPYSQFSSISKEFAEAAFYTPVGTKKTVHVANQGYAGYHYIEVLSQKDMQEAYNVAYIAKPINASTETINGASAAASQFAASSKDQKSFEASAKKRNLAPVSSQEIRKEDYSLGVVGGENRDFIKWIFNNDVGSVSDPYELGDQYVVALITSVEKAGLASAHAARPEVESIIKNEKKAKTIISTKIKGNTLEAVSKSAGVPVQEADSLSFQSPAIPNVGFEPKILGAAFNKNIVSKISDPIAGNAGVFVVKSNGTTALSSTGMSVEQIQNNMKQMMLRQQSNGGNGVFEALRKSASITDNRSDFY